MVKENWYSNIDKGIDYNPSEVDNLIWDEQQRQLEEQMKKRTREEILKGIEDLKNKGVKFCSCCQRKRKFKFFHIDSSKKHFALRSWCKDCRLSEGRK